MNTPVGEAWKIYYKPGMTQEEARAFKAGFYSGIAVADTEEERCDFDCDTCRED